jgi:hypothetical protein
MIGWPRAEPQRQAGGHACCAHSNMGECWELSVGTGCSVARRAQRSWMLASCCTVQILSDHRLLACVERPNKRLCEGAREAGEVLYMRVACVSPPDCGNCPGYDVATFMALLMTGAEASFRSHATWAPCRVDGLLPGSSQLSLAAQVMVCWAVCRAGVPRGALASPLRSGLVWAGGWGMVGAWAGAVRAGAHLPGAAARLKGHPPIETAAARLPTYMHVLRLRCGSIPGRGHQQQATFQPTANKTQARPRRPGCTWLESRGELAGGRRQRGWQHCAGAG